MKIYRVALLLYSGAPEPSTGVIVGSEDLAEARVEWEVFDEALNRRAPCADGSWVRQEVLDVTGLTVAAAWDAAVALAKAREGIG